MIDKQEIFNKVFNHLVSQGKPSFRVKDAGVYWCAYRGNASEACAVGCLITDDAYDSRIEGLAVTDIQ